MKHYFMAFAAVGIWLLFPVSLYVVWRWEKREHAKRVASEQRAEDIARHSTKPNYVIFPSDSFVIHVPPGDYDNVEQALKYARFADSVAKYHQLNSETALAGTEHQIRGMKMINANMYAIDHNRKMPFSRFKLDSMERVEDSFFRINNHWIKLHDQYMDSADHYKPLKNASK